MNAFLALVRKDLKLYFSNKRALIITLAAPIAIAAFFGSLFGSSSSGKPSRLPIAVVDQDNSDISKQVVASLVADTSLDVFMTGNDDAIALVRNGKRRAAIVLPAKFGEDAGRAMFGSNARKPDIAIHFDPSQSMVLPMVRGVLSQHVMKAVMQSTFSANNKLFTHFRTDVSENKDMNDTEKRDLITMFDSIERVQKREGTGGSANAATASKMPGFDLPFNAKASEVTSGVDRKYNSYSHSFSGMSVQFLLFMGIDVGIGLLLARRMGLWKRLRAAPLTRGMLLGSTVASSALIAIILMIGIFAAGMLVFGVRIEGSMLGFAGVVVCFALLTASFGLLLAAIGNNPEATRGLAIFATLLMVMLGGAWVPSFVFPEWLQTVSLYVPTRWAVDGLAAMTWRGLGLEAALAPMGVMLGFSAVMFGLAIWKFRWEE